ncbi:nucleotidyltransferase [Micromonospora sp. NPDC048835]|uniref:nucleotidyltransferase family protein n=1 Tax=Micromonospora sp. NPDC048835 TaxID=3155147 RepID=UPI0033E25298
MVWPLSTGYPTAAPAPRGLWCFIPVDARARHPQVWTTGMPGTGVRNPTAGPQTRRRENQMAERGDESLVHTLKKVAAVLKQSEIPFALGGSFAVYAHGGHSSDHDVDFLIREADVDEALEALVAAGFVAERPPEDWLVKVFDDGRMVDLIHRPIETPVTEETFADTVVRPVDAIRMPVLSATQLMVHKLLSFSQHYCDFARGLPLARSLREQIDWERVRKETQHSPYAEAFLVLLDRLEVVPAAGTQPGEGTS